MLEQKIIDLLKKLQAELKLASDPKLTTLRMEIQKVLMLNTSEEYLFLNCVD